MRLRHVLPDDFVVVDIKYRVMRAGDFDSEDIKDVARFCDENCEQIDPDVHTYWTPVGAWERRVFP